MLNVVRVSLCAMVGLSGVVALSAASEAIVTFEEATLANGLRVLVAEDRAAPVVSIAVTYDVGSRNEQKYRRGFAHLFEHLMFKGSERVGSGEHFTLIFENGGTMNGTTSQDRTLYYETLPAQQLDLALFLEADRMRALEITQASLDNQRLAVQEERRRRFDNQPYGKTEEALGSLAFDNPAYAHSVIGAPEDIESATLPGVQAFYQTYYAPNNAVLAVAGDVVAADAMARVRKYFESIPSRPPAPQVDASEPPQTAERRLVLTDPLAPMTRLDIGFKVPAAMTADEEPLRVAASVLAGGRSSRLYQRIVQQQLATTVSATIGQSRGPTLFRITATVPPNRSAEETERAIQAELDRLKTDGAEPWELQKARAAARRAVVVSLQSSASRAILLSQYALFYRDPGLINGRVARVMAVDADRVARVARSYFSVANRTVVVTTMPARGTGSTE